LARIRPELLITQSLVDRLTDREPWPETRSASVAMFRDSLKRDIEWLLNTRKPVMPELESYPATAASVLNYGFTDIRSFDSSAGKDPNALIRAMEECVRTYEPRILQPRVFLSRSDPLSRSLRFHLEGRIIYEDMEEEIKFDTVLELISGEYEVN
jgi:type VI secretion system protein ImpF